ncbi:MAG TPA: orotidine-5'-phosphate decarboxylase [Candidatus Omnitrophota bacterium]|nr:orotidine-5'-phosphate decarboxylase [Candidatus Omnitrophota bacterium]HPS36494.1 orotidine-5'-phosphate decarboxylase [Candidatus Omnitrophota bacterium]
MSNIPLQEKLIVALDAPTLEMAEKWLSELKGVVHYYKVGLELFTAHSWKAVNLVKNFGGKVFLDLKLHDIPNTVSRTLAAVCEHEVDMVNVHALGGFEMMKAARQSVEQYSAGKTKRPQLIAVTILTSHSQDTLKKELCIRRKVRDEVLHLADLARKAGLDGVVCSPQETPWVRKKCGKDFSIITPGVRPAGAEVGDQKRIETPEKAILNGSDHIVVGRPVTQAKNPRDAAMKILDAIAKVF